MCIRDSNYGWRTEFIGLGVVILIIALISFFTLPSTPGEKLTNSSSPLALLKICLLYTSDAADERSSVDLGGRRIIKKKKRHNKPRAREPIKQKNRKKKQ